MESNEGSCSLSKPNYKMTFKAHRKLYNDYSNVNWQSFWCHSTEGVNQCGPHPPHPQRRHCSSSRSRSRTSNRRVPEIHPERIVTIVFITDRFRPTATHTKKRGNLFIY